MNFKFKVDIAGIEVEIESEAKTNKDVLRKVAFYSELPKEGPSGNKNLVLSHRTPKGFEYFSLLDNEAGKEFSFGTSKETGELFCKGWKDAYVENRVDRDSAPDIALNAKAVHVAKEIIKEEVKEEKIIKPEGNKAMNDVLAKYGLGK